MTENYLIYIIIIVILVLYLSQSTKKEKLDNTSDKKQTSDDIKGYYNNTHNPDRFYS